MQDALSTVRQSLLAHLACITKQQEAYKAAGESNRYFAGHLYGLYNGLAFALRYLADAVPEQEKPFDLRDATVARVPQYPIVNASPRLQAIGASLGAVSFDFLPGRVRFWSADGQVYDLINNALIDGWMPLPVADAAPFAFAILMDEGTPIRVSERFIGDGDHDEYESVPQEDLEAAIFAATGRKVLIDAWDPVSGTTVPEAIASLSPALSAIDRR